MTVVIAWQGIFSAGEEETDMAQKIGKAHIRKLPDGRSCPGVFRPVLYGLKVTDLGK